MLVESSVKLEGLSIQRVVNEVGGEISKALKPRLQSHLLEELPSISISFALRKDKLSGSYSFKEEELLRDVYRTMLMIDTDAGFFGVIRIIKRRGTQTIYVETTNPEGKIKLKTDDNGEWHLDKSEEVDSIDYFELESFRKQSFLDDLKAADVLAYLSEIIKGVDQDLSNDSHVVEYLLNSRARR